MEEKRHEVINYAALWRHGCLCGRFFCGGGGGGVVMW